MVPERVEVFSEQLSSVQIPLGLSSHSSHSNGNSGSAIAIAATPQGLHVLTAAPLTLHRLGQKRTA